MISVRAIIKKNNKYLLIQRSSNSNRFAGFWQFVGGKTDEMNPVQSLKREVKEETNLDISNIRYFTSTYDKERSWRTINYLVDTTGEISLQTEEASNYGWFSKGEIKNLPITPDTKKIIKKL